MNRDPIVPAPRPANGCSPDGVPRHVAIIMDGNGRWANARGLPRTLGHSRGVEAVRRTVRHAGDRGVGVLTLFAFSKENWNRPRAEVNELLGMLRRYISSDLEKLVENGVRVNVIGDRTDLQTDLVALIADAEHRTACNDAMQLVLAFNYSGRDEIVRAARSACAAVAAGDLPVDALDERVFAGFLDTSRWPDPDLVIRTSGELRVSNFLLWQSAYAEYAFPQVMWPDFGTDQFDEALADYKTRQRRFGTVPISVASQ